MNPYVMLLLVLMLLGSGGMAMALVVLHEPATGGVAYCWWC